MNKSIDYITKKLLVDLNNEIYDLESLIDIITDTKSVIDFSVEPTDLRIMRSRLSAFKDAKNMIEKASLKIDGVNGVRIMSVSERKLFYRVVKVIMFFRWLLGISNKDVK